MASTNQVDRSSSPCPTILITNSHQSVKGATYGEASSPSHDLSTSKCDRSSLSDASRLAVTGSLGEFGTVKKVYGNI